MAGLDKILEKIAVNGEDTCRHILAAADDTCREIGEEAGKEAEKLLADAKLNADKQVENMRSKAESGAALMVNRRVLEQKGALIRQTVEKAKASICRLDDAAYFQWLESLILHFAEAGDAKLVLCDRDYQRMPSGFIDGVNRKLSGGCITEAVGGLKNVSGGCLLNYPQTVQNCTLEALLEENADTIRDLLGQILFN